MNVDLITLFFSFTHEKEELIQTFNKKQLLEFYIAGCETRLRLQNSIDNFNEFNERTGITLGSLISNKYHLAKQLNVLKIALEKLGVKGIEEDEYIMLNN
jgi:hypothetical protein